MQRCPIGAEESVYFLLETSSDQLANLIKLVQYPHELFGLPVNLWVQGFLPLMTKTQILAEVTEVFPIEQGSIVAAYRHRYAKQGEGFVQFGYHRSGTGDELYLCLSGLLANGDHKVLSCMN